MKTWKANVNTSTIKLAGVVSQQNVNRTSAAECLCLWQSDKHVWSTILLYMAATKTLEQSVGNNTDTFKNKDKYKLATAAITAYVVFCVRVWQNKKTYYMGLVQINRNKIKHLLRILSPTSILLHMYNDTTFITTLNDIIHLTMNNIILLPMLLASIGWLEARWRSCPSEW